jgi:polysaccharide export outer membrane protein
MNFITLKKILVILLIFQLSDITFATSKKLTQQDLESDIRYYRKISVEKNFTKNDKLYLLNKLFEKYKNSDLDISVIVKEIDSVSKEPKPVVSKPVIGEKKPSVSQQQLQEEQTYVISSGDVIYVHILPSEELSREVVVNADGMITFPLIGTVKAQGLTVKELTTVLEKALSIYISSPKVSITMKSFSKKQIFIMGEIKQSGGYQHKEGMKLLDLITTAGGLTPFAGTKNIKVYRGEKDKKQVFTVNLEEIMKTGDTSKDFILQPGDIVEIPRQPKTVSVIGAVNNPGNFDWYEGITLLEAISLAKGQTDFASLGKIKIFRGNIQQQKVLVVNLDKILKGDLKNNLVLEPGDIVVVPRKPLVGGQWFVNTVLPWMSLIAMTFVIISYTR